MADLMRNSKKKITVRKALYGPGAFLIACAALIFLMSIFFRVKTVEVRGNSYYTAEEVELASGVVEGDNLFFINRFSVVSRIFTRLPYVEDVSLTRYLPNKVVIEISECQALACVSYEGQSWVIDRNCRMLTQADQAEAASLAQVRGITPLTAEVGEVFETGPDDTGKLEYLCAILDQIQERGMTADVGYIDISNINSPSFSYKDRFVVKLGNFEETEYRFGKLLSAVSQLVEGDRGTIDVSPEGEKTVFSPY